ncbi:hypothetical protein EDD15DRAFT_1305779 [Pisolithus albus]|nr:hypothetical protein EDD15DRAFT_1305779 [Pisolithus albus]
MTRYRMPVRYRRILMAPSFCSAVRIGAQCTLTCLHCRHCNRESTQPYENELLYTRHPNLQQRKHYHELSVLSTVRRIVNIPQPYENELRKKEKETGAHLCVHASRDSDKCRSCQV